MGVVHIYSQPRKEETSFLSFAPFSDALPGDHQADCLGGQCTVDLAARNPALVTKWLQGSAVFPTQAPFRWYQFESNYRSHMDQTEMQDS